MKTKLLATTLVALCLTLFAQAQTIDTGGKLMGQSYFDITDMLRFSQTGYTSGTARSSAMGGAFTSLGADLSSMSINPAGLGMYQSSDVGITLAVPFTKSTTTGIGTTVYNRGGSDTKFNVNNLGFVFNVYESSKMLTDINIGIAYNRLANFNSENIFEVRQESTSISDVFINQLYDMQRAGIKQTDMNSSNNPFQNNNIFVNEWGAVLSYQTEAVYGEGDEVTPSYTINRSMSNDATTNSLLTTHTTGGIGEYAVSFGGNLSNFLYFGATLGIRSVNYTEANYYEEAYNNNTVQYPIDFMMYDQNVKVSGSGVNMKIGVTARPFDGFRIGVAFHTPTYLSLTKSYSAAMRARFQEAGGATNDVTKYTNTNSYNYRYSTAPKLLLGASYTFGTWAVLSVDYESSWYNGMRLKGADRDTRDAYKEQIKNHYRNGNAVRAGLEVKPLKWMSLRGGFGYEGSMLKGGTEAMFITYDNPVAYDILAGSAGLGFRFSNMYLDITYTYNRIKQSPYMMYYYYNSDGTYGRNGAQNADNKTITQYGYYSDLIVRHSIMMAFGVRF